MSVEATALLCGVLLGFYSSGRRTRTTHRLRASEHVVGAAHDSHGWWRTRGRPQILNVAHARFFSFPR